MALMATACSHILSLPSEVQEVILALAGAGHHDEPGPTTLLSAEATCAKWSAILRASPVYKNKCRAFLDRFPEHAPTFVRHKFETNSENPEWCKRFYFGLLRLRHSWREADPEWRSADCLSAEVDGVKADHLSPEWRRHFNYFGVYDMVYDAARGRLVCSVFETIQVWDVNTMTCVRIFGPKVLDDSSGSGAGESRDGLGRVGCFHASGSLLACGTSRGAMKLFDMDSEESCGSWPGAPGAAAIADVKMVGSAVLAVDCYGKFQEWEVDAEKKTMRKVGPAFEPPLDEIDSMVTGDGDAGDSFRQAFIRRDHERLLDFNEEFIATTSSRSGSLLLFDRTVSADGGRSFAVVLGESNILCLKVVGRTAYWGEGKGAVKRVEVKKGARSCLSREDGQCEGVRTRFGDNVTSIDVSGDWCVIGDVNGEVHLCALDRFARRRSGDKEEEEEEGRPNRVLETGHTFGSYVWCVKADAERIFSGDQDGKLIVHDFWRETKM